MSLIRPHIFTLFALITLLGFAACKRDKCKRVDCVYGTCVEGTCECQRGYEGELCGEASNAKFVGSFSLEESCLAGADDYNVSIAIKQGTVDTVTITGLWEQAQTITAVTWPETDRFKIARQSYGTKEIEGTGVMDPDAANQINLTYKIYNPGATSPLDECTAALSK